jgi:DNA polymerase-3 subunit beta
VDYDGPDVEIGFNARYLMDFLGVVGTASVHVELNPQRPAEAAQDKADAGDKPGQFRPEPPRGLDYRYVVMPMHL